MNLGSKLKRFEFHVSPPPLFDLEVSPKGLGDVHPEKGADDGQWCGVD